ncbi:hypothetical protein C2E23DRAFT_23664 [Lenzites betulinus]|nr:hypothetical protein C2E23DRAFT_23664 [Lenzites betulinus]
MRRIEALQNRVHELEKANIELATTVRVMNNVFPLGHLNSGDTSTPGNSSPAHVKVNGLLVPNADIPSPKYDKDSHENFRFWTAGDWAPYTTGNSKSEHAMSSDGVPIYLEDDEGNVFSSVTYADLRNLVKRLFRTLADHSLAPSTWGTRNAHAARYIQCEIYKVFPVLAQCTGHFRVHALVTRMYPDFVRYRKGNEPLKQEDTLDSSCNADVALPKSKGKHKIPGPPSQRAAKRSKHENIIAEIDSGASTAIESAYNTGSGSRESVAAPKAVAPARVAFSSFAVSYKPTPAHLPPLPSASAATHPATDGPSGSGSPFSQPPSVTPRPSSPPVARSSDSSNTVLNTDTTSSAPGPSSTTNATVAVTVGLGLAALSKAQDLVSPTPVLSAHSGLNETFTVCIDLFLQLLHVSLDRLYRSVIHCESCCTMFRERHQ